jgi:hypothetical protein
MHAQIVVIDYRVKQAKAEESELQVDLESPFGFYWLASNGLRIVEVPWLRIDT